MAHAVNRRRLKTKSLVRSWARPCDGVGLVAQSLQGFTTGWTVGGSNSDGSESPGSYPDSRTMGTGFFFRRYSGRGVTFTTHLHLAPKLKE